MKVFVKKDKNSLCWKIYLRILSIIRYLLKYIFKFYPFNLIPAQSKQYSIILVNWIHKIPNHILLNSLIYFYHNNLNPGGEIIIDSIFGNQDNYPCQHDFEKINQKLSSDMQLIGIYSMGKNQDIIRKTKSFKKV